MNISLDQIPIDSVAAALDRATEHGITALIVDRGPGYVRGRSTCAGTCGAAHLIDGRHDIVLWWHGLISCDCPATAFCQHSAAVLDAEGGKLPARPPDDDGSDPFAGIALESATRGITAPPASVVPTDASAGVPVEGEARPGIRGTKDGPDSVVSGPSRPISERCGLGADPIPEIVVHWLTMLDGRRVPAYQATHKVGTGRLIAGPLSETEDGAVVAFMRETWPAWERERDRRLAHAEDTPRPDLFEARAYSPDPANPRRSFQAFDPKREVCATGDTPAEAVQAFQREVWPDWTDQHATAAAKRAERLAASPPPAPAKNRVSVKVNDPRQPRKVSGVGRKVKQ